MGILLLNLARLKGCWWQWRLLFPDALPCLTLPQIPAARQFPPSKAGYAFKAQTWKSRQVKIWQKFLYQGRESSPGLGVFRGKIFRIERLLQGVDLAVFQSSFRKMMTSPGLKTLLFGPGWF
jgi:hypothetical protein